MLISRTLARRRIRAGVRPSFKAAWWPVLADTLLIFALLAMLFLPLVSLTLTMTLAWRLITLMVLIYVPFQAVTILSTIWAIRSRWEDKDQSSL